MKITPVLFATLLVATLAAQEPAPAPAPAPDPAKPQMRSTPPSPIAPPPGLSNEQPQLPLIPDTPENTQKPQGGGAIAEPKRDKTAAAENELIAHLRLRELRYQVLKDPKIQAEWVRAHATKTDAERRVVLANYYTMLYTKMAKLDSTMAKRITDLQTIAVHRLAQHNIEPSEVVEEDYSPDGRNR
jgi:hypothetical protein